MNEQLYEQTKFLAQSAVKMISDLTQLLTDVPSQRKTLIKQLELHFKILAPVRSYKLTERELQIVAFAKQAVADLKKK